MKTAICYYSRHHGNTRKLLESMAQEGDVDLIDVTTRQAVRLEGYDCIAFASGIYFGTFHNSVLAFARAERGCPVLGEFGCRGYDTFGPFKLVGGIAKGRPDGRDLEHARSFYRDLRTDYDSGGMK